MLKHDSNKIKCASNVMKHGSNIEKYNKKHAGNMLKLDSMLKMLAMPNKM